MDSYLRLTVCTFRTDRHPCLQTVICSWWTVRFVRTVILADGPNTERASHYHTRVNCWRSERFVRSVTFAYRPLFAIDGRTFRTCFARTIILDYGPLFAVHSLYAEVHMTNTSMNMSRYLSVRTKRSTYMKGKTVKFYHSFYKCSVF